MTAEGDADGGRQQGVDFRLLPSGSRRGSRGEIELYNCAIWACASRNKAVCYTSRMDARRAKLLSDLAGILSENRGRVVSLKEIAGRIRTFGGYRWVGLYDVDHKAGVVTNIVWSGPSAPEYPSFPIQKGLTGAAITGRQAVNVGDVAADPRYLTALGSTRSEIIVPVFDIEEKMVVGTIDVESEQPNAFGSDVESLLQACSDTIQPLWNI
jgi:L-methionine (R)-S-oxide reductase